MAQSVFARGRSMIAVKRRIGCLAFLVAVCIQTVVSPDDGYWKEVGHSFSGLACGLVLLVFHVPEAGVQRNISWCCRIGGCCLVALLGLYAACYPWHLTPALFPTVTTETSRKDGCPALYWFSWQLCSSCAFSRSIRPPCARMIPSGASLAFGSRTGLHALWNRQSSCWRRQSSWQPPLQGFCSLFFYGQGVCSPWMDSGNFPISNECSESGAILLFHALTESGFTLCLVLSLPMQPLFAMKIGLKNYIASKVASSLFLVLFLSIWATYSVKVSSCLFTGLHLLVLEASRVRGLPRQQTLWAARVLRMEMIICTLLGLTTFFAWAVFFLFASMSW